MVVMRAEQHIFTVICKHTTGVVEVKVIAAGGLSHQDTHILSFDQCY